MTDQQLRALRRKHLLIIIRDLEKELQKALADKEQLLQAYQSGCEQMQRGANAHTQFTPAWQVLDSGRTDWPLQGFQQQPYAAQYAPPQWPNWQQPADMGYTQDWAQEIRPQELWMQQGAAGYG